jgi:phenylalanyl-tRNA synthetase beta subunit
MNYTFVDKGDIELQKPLSPEKKYLRTNLTDGIKNSLEINSRYSEIIDMPQIKIFEFGHIFNLKGEYEHFVIGIKNPVGVKKPKEKDVLDEVLKKLTETLNLKFHKINQDLPAQAGENIAEFLISEMIEDLPEVSEYDFPKEDNRELKFKKISQFPFMIRDIAVFTPKGTEADDVFSIIKNGSGELMVKSRLFDVFEKTLSDGEVKTSYAYRLIFQSHERTLTDDEVNSIMAKITDKMNANTGWQVR